MLYENVPQIHDKIKLMMMVTAKKRSKQPLHPLKLWRGYEDAPLLVHAQFCPQNDQQALMIKFINTGNQDHRIFLDYK